MVGERPLSGVHTYLRCVVAVLYGFPSTSTPSGASLIANNTGYTTTCLVRACPDHQLGLEARSLQPATCSTSQLKRPIFCQPHEVVRSLAPHAHTHTIV